MNEPRPARQHILEYALAVGALLVLLLFSYAKFFVLPYPGFIFNSSNGEIRDVYVSPVSPDTLLKGDRLVRIGPVRWEVFKEDLQLTLFEGVVPGQVVRLTVQREGQERTLPWVFPGPNRAEVLDRFNSVLILAYFFWLAGLATLLLVRPKDTRWRLMLAFFFLTAMWIASGSLSAWHIWGSALLLRVLIWLCLPVYLHLHWIFPQPLGRAPRFAGALLYGLALTMAGLQAFQLLPVDLYFLGFILAILGSSLLIVVRVIVQPAQRRDMALLVGGTLLAFLPLLSVSVGGMMENIAIPALFGFYAIPIFPGMYFFTLYRRQPGGQELRANRALAGYIFFILLGTALAIVVPWAHNHLVFPGATYFVGVSTALLTGLLAAYSYPKFVRLFEHHILRIPLPPGDLLEEYAARVVTGLDIQRLTHLLRDEILPSLLVRQSALLHLTLDHAFEPIYTSGIQASQLPTGEVIARLVMQARKRPREPFLCGTEGVRGCPSWVLLCLLLMVEDKPVGLWLLGKKDPEDHYLPSDISILQTIANQTAIALLNIAQAERLRTLYQANIDRQETERTNLARELHDEVLNQLAAFSMTMDSQSFSSIEVQYQQLEERIRHMIKDLRPAMLNFGLYTALKEMTEQPSERPGTQVTGRLEVPPSKARFNPKVESHLYRIVQQACENALFHASPKTICIQGMIAHDQVRLTIEDDGCGFVLDNPPNFDQLLASQHFGIVGMFERADLIGAELRIDTAPGAGTRVMLSWRQSEETP